MTGLVTEMIRMPRILLLLFSLSVITMMFVAKFGLNIDRHLYHSNNGFPVYKDHTDSKTARGILKEREIIHRQEVDNLKLKIQYLESELFVAKEHFRNLSNKVENEVSSKEDTEGKNMLLEGKPQDYEKYFQDKILSAEITRGLPLKTEYDVVAFNRFTLNRVYLVDPGLGKRVIEKPIGYKKKDLFEIVAFAVDQLNQNRSTSSTQYGLEDFLEGLYRHQPTTGCHYELYFRSREVSAGNTYTKVIMLRPYGPPMLVINHQINTIQEWINLILPLSGRVDTFRLFIQRFINVCIKQDKRIFLTVVYFGKEGLKEVKDLMSQTARMYKFKHMKLVTLKETFTRGRGLQIGALNWKGGDVLLFLCDVDIIFNNEFLERCRLNTERGKRVYYPIVFSLYNPNVVYSLHDMEIPSLRDQLVISKDTGFWRDFGYGMTCQYRSDFLTIKGFDEQITGWGGEDVFLYQKYVRSDYLVIRATDPGIFHMWHEKYCDPNLSTDQYRSCIRSKALNEASHAQLGLLAFKDEVDVHRGFEHNRQLGGD
ncbi:chondroitin sulfate N-acetylgalactosaminyltransferase 1-like [Gigantopelta aegis]|uniref:chondroitin sulfate N-acetylgalactosaminyltransferase 1-like n=1 Tax=Gigantopelta aegis TaxID=1735272 RepID=UPI001B88ACFA|nr:chondroitin sulfate N-acetylgalactosaminyltransferase 1-like [Gigantopelta aegis]